MLNKWKTNENWNECQSFYLFQGIDSNISKEEWVDLGGENTFLSIDNDTNSEVINPETLRDISFNANPKVEIWYNIDNTVLETKANLKDVFNDPEDKLTDKMTNEVLFNHYSKGEISIKNSRWYRFNPETSKLQKCNQFSHLFVKGWLTSQFKDIPQEHSA